MKIRLGFVSNSSSSSFIVIGSELTNGEFLGKAKELIKVGRLYGEGEWCCEGIDFFKITKEMWQIYVDSMNKQRINFYDAQIVSEEYGKIKKSDIKGEEFEVHLMDIDQHHTVSVEDFISRYIKD